VISVQNLQLNSRLSLKSLNFKEGKINIIIGPNGAGKSSLLEILSKNIEFRDGDITINSRSLTEISLGDLSQIFSYLPQKLDWNPALLVKDIILFGLYPFTHNNLLTNDDNERLSYLVQSFELEDLLSRPFGKLSGGEQKRVAIASTLFQDTKIIVMDEPFAALDPLHKRRVAEILKKWQQDQGVTMILSIHDLYIAHHIGDSFIGLKEGRILGEREDLSQSFLESLFDTKFSLFKMEGHEVFLPALGERNE